MRVSRAYHSTPMDYLQLLQDADRVPSPCFVIDAPRLAANAAILRDVQERCGARILLALKGFAAWGVFPLLTRDPAHGGQGPLYGACASSVDEARLARECFGGEVHAFAAAWSDEEMAELLSLADHITFNSMTQWNRFAPTIAAHNAAALAAGAPGRMVTCGLRINPEHSEGAVAIYNPCSPGSRLGIRPRHMPDSLPDGLTGLHWHTLCEQDADAAARTVEAVEQKFAPYLRACRWLNMGGGHHITRPGYDVDLLCRTVSRLRATYADRLYLEPGEAVALNAGWLVATVLDVVEADMPVAVLDTSAACHMPDVLEMPYRPNVMAQENGRWQTAGQPGEKAWSCRLAGKSCLAGDVIGEYAFAAPLEPGQRLVFADMAIYSMVKTTTFNGLRLPSIGVLDAAPGATDPLASASFGLLKSFGYEDFKYRLS